MPVTWNIRIRAIGVVCTVTAALLAMPVEATAVAAHQRSHHRVQPIVLHRAPSPQPSIGAPEPEQYPGVPITINSLTRDSFGFATLVWTITNNTNERFYVPSGWQGTTYTYADAPISGVTLTDETAKVRYQPLRIDPSKQCTCNSDFDQVTVMEHGATSYYFQTYKLPMNVKSVTVSMAAYAPAKNIPISNAR